MRFLNEVDNILSELESGHLVASGLDLRSVFDIATKKCLDIESFSTLSERSEKLGISRMAVSFRDALMESGVEKEITFLDSKWSDFKVNRMDLAVNQRLFEEFSHRVALKENFIKQYGGEYVCGSLEEIRGFFVRGSVKRGSVTRRFFSSTVHEMVKKPKSFCESFEVAPCRDGWSYVVYAWGGIVSVERFINGRINEHRVFKKATSKTINDVFHTNDRLDLGLRDELVLFESELADVQKHYQH